jgi:hypothetical protein
MNFTLLLCLSPLAVVFVLMKVITWMTAVKTEAAYVRQEPSRQRGPYVADAYDDVDQEEEGD